MFYWMGDPSVFLAMIKLIEDAINVDHDTEEADVEVILFVEDSVKFISSYLPQLYMLLIQQKTYHNTWLVYHNLELQQVLHFLE